MLSYDIGRTALLFVDPYDDFLAEGGTFGGSSLRSAIARAFGSDRPAALLEDAIAIVGAALIVVAL